MVIKTLLIAASLMSSAALAFTDRNDIPSCSQGLPDDLVTTTAERELFVIIDRTMSASLNDRIMQETYGQISRFIRPGDSIQIIQFSSYNKDGFTSIALKGKTDMPLSKDSRDEVRKSQLAKFDKCLKDQKRYFLAKTGFALKDSFSAQENTDFTEVLAALRDISTQIVKNSNAKDKVVLLISDMLENSASTSFYQRGSVRTIDPKKEIDQVIDRSELGDFAGARVYVMGAGLLPGGQSYVSSTKMNAIERFWSGYFSESNSDLRGFGKPLLLTQFQ
ncbi:hypothetical protein A1OO_19090 [Enterovibrio norvegicus FF-33]|uniref:VWFA domain-containing protein n=1 Tax=Enterovibrio norvegicus FF-454 TaxID=1185651 RepID=A0A1E5C0J7_9GAMM|nr:hypothetical protein [Enterovibrio norvegicus]OEE59000.1 hypothetical protein A1OK_03050 [Enterovibrio norvegicus FF-454]OEE67844.1 hypothetical protein A1OO_19090 [Enterovibrio norvegicus FF-33]OEE78648.1 hypothetical protein A1OQ_21675 [Enterovibrio norvegicus FF-162]